MTDGICSIEDCMRPIRNKSRRLCNRHYLRWRRHGDPHEGAKSPDPFDGTAGWFWVRVDQSGDCWVWTRGRSHGYGTFYIPGIKNPISAHRFSYELLMGPIPDGLVIDHICHNTTCVRPDHLRAVTQKQNTENQSGPPSNNTSGVVGVSWDKTNSRWRASVRHNNKIHHLGRFLSIEEAEAAVIAKRNELFTHNDMDRQ